MAGACGDVGCVGLEVLVKHGHEAPFAGFEAFDSGVDVAKAGLIPVLEVCFLKAHYVVVVSEHRSCDVGFFAFQAADVVGCDFEVCEVRARASFFVGWVTAVRGGLAAVCLPLGCGFGVGGGEGPLVLAWASLGWGGLGLDW